MFRPSTIAVVGFLTGIVLLRGTVHAQVTTTTLTPITTTTTTKPTTTTAKATTTTTITTTTTTTLAPHPFSPATKECIKTARDMFDCHHKALSQCSSAFQKAYAECFEGSAGMSCATKCLTTESKCFSSLPTTQKKCRSTCRTSKKNDVKACRLLPVGDTIWASADQGCLITADQTFGNCKFQCTTPQQKMDCETSFTFCIANCPNLPS
jgi:hypothetical protein